MKRCPACSAMPRTWSPNAAATLSIASMLFCSGPFLEGFALDLLLDFHDGVDDALRARRTTRNVDVDRDEAVDALDHGVVVEDAPAGGAGSHRDAPLRLRHLLPDLEQDR